jgi:hypothetical protein
MTVSSLSDFMLRGEAARGYPDPDVPPFNGNQTGGKAVVMTAGSRICALLLPMVWSVAGQQRLDVYFLAVGSEHYVDAPGPVVNSMPTIDGMIKSARAVAGVLDNGGSAFGMAHSGGAAFREFAGYRCGSGCAHRADSF